MGALNWKGDDHPRYGGDWRARASRIVGGEYRITKVGGDRNVLGYYAEISYSVTHGSRASGICHSLYDRDLWGVMHNARTLDRVMALAQADNDYRCRIAEETENPTS
jgi:hypothetical protein